MGPQWGGPLRRWKKEAAGRVGGRILPNKESDRYSKGDPLRGEAHGPLGESTMVNGGTIITVQ